MGTGGASIDGTDEPRAHIWGRRVLRLTTVQLVILALVRILDILLGGSLVGGGDVPVFDDRARALLSGDITYRTTFLVNDVPPLINLFFIFPHLAGGTVFAYQVLFGLANVVTGLAIWRLIDAVRPGAGGAAAYFYNLHPITWLTAYSIVQDETLVPLFVVLAVIAMAAARPAAAGVWTALGVLVKAWPVIAALVLLLRSKGPDSIRLLVGAAVPALLFIVPYLILAPEYLQHLVSFYAGGHRPEHSIETGLSLWTAIQHAGLPLSETLLSVLAMAAVLLVAVRARRKRLPVLDAVGAAFAVFLVLYPKTHLGYYLLPLALMAHHLAPRGFAFRVYLIATAALLVAHYIWRRMVVLGPFTVPTHIAAMLIVDAALLWVAWRLLGTSRHHPEHQPTPDPAASPGSP